MEFAPDVAMLTWKNESLTLGQFKNKKIWLAFFRYAACPLCNLRIHEMIQRYDELKKKGVQILAVFQSSPESIAEYVGKQSPPFPLIADPKERLYQIFGLKKGWWAFVHPGNTPLLAKAIWKRLGGMKPEGTVNRIPGDFLMNPGLRVSRVYHGNKVGDHIPWSEVEQFVKEP
ncbi:MAG: AhpC/TSA family protein [Deltaproteobacteria bacterium]|nr:AhpC/TSA family protein [Deltaproteobacteria bacterium]